MFNPFVSVIIPNYCHSKYLDQRIQSVLNQTYQNFEVIILDDASPDGGKSKAVIEKYRDNPHVSHIVYNEINSGNTFIQWHRGIQLASGDYCWIAESDDYCVPMLLEQIITAIQTNANVVLAYSTINVVNESGLIIEEGVKSKQQFFYGKQYIKRYLSLANFVRNASCAVFSKRVALEIPCDYIHFSSAGDYLFWVYIAGKGNVAIINNPLSFFRRHEGVVTTNRDSDGTNFKAEYIIFGKINDLVHLSYLRRISSLKYHWDRIIYQHFDTVEIRQSILELWNVPEKYSLFHKVITKVQNYFRRKFNCYI